MCNQTGPNGLVYSLFLDFVNLFPYYSLVIHNGSYKTRIVKLMVTTIIEFMSGGINGEKLIGLYVIVKYKLR